MYLTTGPAWITDNALYPTRVAKGIDVEFLALALSVAGLNDARNRNDLPLITQAILHATPIALPGQLDEQRAIAVALHDVDNAMAASEQLIAKKRDVKQAAMQRLLSGEQRLPGFSHEWKRTTLGALGSFSKGAGIRRDELSVTGVPCIRYGEIYTRYAAWVAEPVSRISASVARTSQRIRPGDVLFAASGETAEEIGKAVAYVGRGEVYAGGDIVILTPAGQDAMFLGYLLNHSTIVAQKARAGQGDAVVHIGARQLSALEMLLPELDEQRAIAAVLSDMDAEITALEQRLTKTRALKQAMMQELLTGRTRLVPSTPERPA